jgi:hypothetical protein
MRATHLEELPRARFGRASRQPGGTTEEIAMDMQPHTEHATLHIASRYTRTQALEDGDLVDITEAAEQLGIRLRVAISREAWNLCVATTPAAEKAGHHERRRLHDVVSMLHWAMRQSVAGRELAFEVRCITTSLRDTCIPLRAIYGLGEDCRPAMTLVLPEDVS